MRRLFIALSLVGILSAGASQAQEKPKAEVGEQAVLLSPVALPIVIDGRLVNYVFVTAKIWLTPHADLFTLRDKEPYFRDALVRAARRTPFTLPNDYNRIDEEKLKAALFKDATAIAGPGKIQSVQVLSQAPQHRLSAGR